MSQNAWLSLQYIAVFWAIQTAYIFNLYIHHFIISDQYLLQVEMEKEKKAKHRTYQRVALVLALVFLVLALSVFSLRYLWSSRPGKVRLKSHLVVCQSSAVCDKCGPGMEAASANPTGSFKERRNYASKEADSPTKSRLWSLYRIVSD